jgi:hypothetical protein
MELDEEQFSIASTSLLIIEQVFSPGVRYFKLPTKKE